MLFISFAVQAQSPIGAWENMYTAENGDQIKRVVIFTDGYQVRSTYDTTSGEFISTSGGSWTLEGDTMTETIEFDSINSERVGSELNFEVSITDNELQVKDGSIFKRIDDGQPGALEGAWLMSARKRNGEIQQRDTSRPRKTMKILSGTRFQWIAYNTETKQFSGTGGGTYTTENGEYVETIEFFSKDDAKVGLSLKFNYELIDGKWHHKGFSSKGDPVYEIWSLRD